MYDKYDNVCKLMYLNKKIISFYSVASKKSYSFLNDFFDVEQLWLPKCSITLQL